jgi:hypothetical protein
MKVMKVTGFNLRREDEETLQQLSAKLGWNRSQIIRELLARARVQGPSVDVVLPLQGELKRESFSVLD